MIRSRFFDFFGLAATQIEAILRNSFKCLIVVLSALIALSSASLAQEVATPSNAEQIIDPGVALKAPKDATLTAISPIPDLIVGWEGRKKWKLEHGDVVPFYYARYQVNAETKTKKGKAAAGTDLYGIYYNAGNGTDKNDGKWIVKPEWSGLFPLNTDHMLVRAPGTETWYVLRVSNGKLPKLGEGQIGTTDIIDEETTGRRNLWGNELHYLITQDDGKRQTIQLMRRVSLENRFELLSPIDNVVPATVKNGSPVKVLLERDFVVRRYGRNDVVYDFSVDMTTRLDPFKNQPKPLSVVEVTAPFRQAMFVLDAEKQLYLPVPDPWYAAFAQTEMPKYPGYLGFRPVGSGITTGLKDNPLEAYRDGFMAMVWNTNKGLRLAPLPADWQTYMRSIDTWGRAKWDERETYFFNYKRADHATSWKQWWVYTELYPIDIPEEVRNDRDPTLAWYNGLYAVRPNGKVDVLITQKGINNGVFYNANAESLANMDAAKAFVARSMTVEGRKTVYAHYLNLMKENQAKLDEADRLKAEKEQAAAFAHREAERRALEAKKDRVWARLRAKDYYGALNLAASGGDTRFLPEAIVKTMEDGYEHIITYELAEAGLRWANEKQKTYCMNRMWKLRPQAYSAVEYGPAYRGPSTSAPASADNSQQQIMDAARQRSRDNYNSGRTSSYLCGSAQFCD